MKLQKILLLSAVVLGLSACTKVQTAEYYAKNPDEAKKVMMKCESTVKKGSELNEKEMKNCENAAKGMMSGMMSEITKGL
ncbi:hypothetical protein EC844_101326 [Acinetobacter calcoaceticus]|uniref:EexN family lipoprotein n=1 Tax=Acinetobacter calcoaceticus TaxID=471 RepID=A0A4R1Y7A9_ACICA|nr:hypothetical protein EC844_101326 [Acinetobacter calcoaceticus]